MALSCLVAVVVAEGHVGLGGFGGYGSSIGGLGAAYGGLGGPPGASVAGPIGDYGPRPFGGGPLGLTGLGAGFRVVTGALEPDDLEAGFGRLGSVPIGPSGGLYAPSNYQFGYGVQAEGYRVPATFGHNEEHNAYETIGNYHVNTPGSFQSVNYNIPH